jgi:hypothetical protein
MNNTYKKIYSLAFLSITSVCVHGGHENNYYSQQTSPCKESSISASNDINQTGSSALQTTRNNTVNTPNNIDSLQELINCINKDDFHTFKRHLDLYKNMPLTVQNEDRNTLLHEITLKDKNILFFNTVVEKMKHNSYNLKNAFENIKNNNNKTCKEIIIEKKIDAMWDQYALKLIDNNISLDSSVIRMVKSKMIEAYYNEKLPLRYSFMEQNTYKNLLEITDHDISAFMRACRRKTNLYPFQCNINIHKKYGIMKLYPYSYIAIDSQMPQSIPHDIQLSKVISDIMHTYSIIDTESCLYVSKFIDKLQPPKHIVENHIETLTTRKATIKREIKEKQLQNNTIIDRIKNNNNDTETILSGLYTHEALINNEYEIQKIDDLIGALRKELAKGKFSNLISSSNLIPQGLNSNQILKRKFPNYNMQSSLSSSGSSQHGINNQNNRYSTQNNNIFAPFPSIPHSTTTVQQPNPIKVRNIQSASFQDSGKHSYPEKTTSSAGQKDQNPGLLQSMPYNHKTHPTVRTPQPQNMAHQSDTRTGPQIITSNQYGAMQSNIDISHNNKQKKLLSIWVNNIHTYKLDIKEKEDECSRICNQCSIVQDECSLIKSCLLIDEDIPHVYKQDLRKEMIEKEEKIEEYKRLIQKYRKEIQSSNIKINFLNKKISNVHYDDTK